MLRVAATVAVAVAIAAVTLLAVVWQRHGSPAADVGHGTAANYVEPVDGVVSIRNIPDDAAAPPHVELVAAIMSDLAVFWAEKLPALSGRPFTALRGGVVAIDSAVATRGAPCVHTPGYIVGNAFYCPSNDGIVYDSAALVPVLLDRYGAAGLTATFAHEYGHAIQARLAASPSTRSAASTGSSLLREAQADCYAGAFLAWMTAGHAPHLHLGPDMLGGAIGPLADFADPATVSPSDPTAHGLAIDRVTWMLLGFRHDAGRCSAMTMDALDPILGSAGRFAENPSAVASPRFTNQEALLTAADRSISDFLPGPGTGTAEARTLRGVAPFGQFAQATVLADAFAVASHGVDSAAGDAAARTDAACMAGAWVASVYGSAPPGALGSWRGDVDQGLDAIRHMPRATFDRVAAYVDGFHDGIAVCHQAP